MAGAAAWGRMWWVKGSAPQVFSVHPPTRSKDKHILTTKGSHSAQLESQQLRCPSPQKTPESKGSDMATALEGNPDPPKKGPALHYPWGSWGQTLPGDRLGSHAQLLCPAPQALLARVYRILSSHSPQSNCPGFVGSCPGGAGALGEFLLESRGILLRVIRLRWENTDMPWVTWADVCPSSGRIHSLIHSLIHSFPCHFLSIYCVPSTALDTKGTTVNQAIVTGASWAILQGTHTHTIPHPVRASRTASQRRWGLSETCRLNRCQTGGGVGKCIPDREQHGKRPRGEWG